MTKIISHQKIEEKILTVRGQSVLLDRDVAEFYGIETKEVNQAVKNNSEKFPRNYIIALSLEEWNSLRSKFLTLNAPKGRGQHVKYRPQAFTEKGLYMLATILKGPKATQTTIAIVETFVKMRELSKAINQLSKTTEKDKQKTLMQNSGEILADLLSYDELEVSGDETTIELNLAFVKLKKMVKRSKKK